MPSFLLNRLSSAPTHIHPLFTFSCENRRGICEKRIVRWAIVFPRKAIPCLQISTIPRVFSRLTWTIPDSQDPKSKSWKFERRRCILWLKNNPRESCWLTSIPLSHSEIVCSFFVSSVEKPQARKLCDSVVVVECARAFYWQEIIRLADCSFSPAYTRSYDPSIPIPSLSPHIPISQVVKRDIKPPCLETREKSWVQSWHHRENWTMQVYIRKTLQQRQSNPKWGIPT